MSITHILLELRSLTKRGLATRTSSCCFIVNDMNIDVLNDTIDGVSYDMEEFKRRVFFHMSMAEQESWREDELYFKKSKTLVPV